MTRKEIYQKIKEQNLQDAIKAQFGDNYTRVSSDLLEAFINKQGNEPAQKKEEKKEAKPELHVTKAESAYEAVCLVFLGFLKDNGLLDDLLKKL